MVKTTDLVWCRANIVRCFFAHLVEWFLLVKQRWAKPRWWKIGRKWPKNPAKGVKNLDGKPLQGLNPTCSLLQSQSKHTSCKKERKGLKVYIIVFLFAKAEIQIVSILWIQSTSQLCWFATVGKHFLKNRPYVLCNNVVASFNTLLLTLLKLKLVDYLFHISISLRITIFVNSGGWRYGFFSWYFLHPNW